MSRKPGIGQEHLWETDDDGLPVVERRNRRRRGVRGCEKKSRYVRQKMRADSMSMDQWRRAWRL